jgi:ABC-type multidrug transport system ATPase subunit
VIEFKRVGKTYRPLLGRAVRAVDEFTLHVRAGEVLGLAGPNGAGKSTLIGLMLGFLRPTDGSVRVGGLEPREYVERHGVGYLSELMAINPIWTAEGALRRYAVLSGVPEQEVGPRVDDAIERLGLGEHRAKRVKALSKGNLQKVGLAQALLRESGDGRGEQVLVLDEPTHGLDPVWTQRFREIVTGLRRPDRAIFIASHNLDELQRVADRVVIIDRGKLQRVVDVRAGAAAGAVIYRVALDEGAEHVPAVFPGAEMGAAPGEFVVRAEDLAALSRGVAELLRLGAVLRELSPAHSALEQHFREAVGES